MHWRYHCLVTIYDFPSTSEVTLKDIGQIDHYQCTWKTFMIHETFVWWALYILFKSVKSLIRHLGLAIGNVWCVRWFSWTLHYPTTTTHNKRQTMQAILCIKNCSLSVGFIPASLVRPICMGLRGDPWAIPWAIFSHKTDHWLALVGRDEHKVRAPSDPQVAPRIYQKITV